MDTNSPEFHAALRDHAKSLGVDPDTESHLLGLVQQALLAELPEPWEQGETEDGTLYYFNPSTEESIWEHPLDSHYRELVATKKKEAQIAKQSVNTKADEEPISDPVTAGTNEIEVYSFDQDSDDDSHVRRATDGKTSSDAAAPSSRISSFFSRPTPSVSASSKATKSESILASSSPSPLSGLGATTTSGNPSSAGFGRDRSWLLDDDDDDAVQPLSLTGGSSKAAASSSATSERTTTSVRLIDSMNKSQGIDSVSPLIQSAYTSRPVTPSTSSFGASNASGSTDAPSSLSFTSRLFGSANTPPATPSSASLISIPVENGPINNSSKPGLSPPSSPTATPSPKTSSSRRGLASSFFQDMGSATAAMASSSTSTPIVARSVRDSSSRTSAFRPVSTMSPSSPTASPLAQATNKGDAARIEELESSVMDQRKQIDKLRAELSSTKDKLAAAEQDAKEANYLKMKVNESKGKLSACESKLNDQTKELERVQGQLQMAIREKEALVCEIDLLRRDKEAHVREKEALVKTHRDALAAAMLQQESGNEANNIIETLTSEVRKLEAKCADLEALVAQREREKDESDVKARDALAAAVEAERRQHSQDLTSMRERHEATAKLHADDVTRWREQVEAIRKERDAIERGSESVSTLQSNLERQIRLTKESEEKVKHLTTQLRDAENRITAADHDTKQRVSDHEAVVQKLAHTSAALTASDDRVRDAQERLHAEQQRVREMDATMKQRESDVDQWARENQRVERELKDAQCEARDANAQVKALQREIQQLKASDATTTAALQTELHVVTAQLNAVKTKEVGPLEKQCAQHVVDKERLQERVTAMERDLRGAQQELATELSNTHQLQVQVEAWKRKEQQHRAQRDTYLEEKLALEKQLSTVTTEMATFHHEKRLESDKLAFRVRELESQVSQREYEIVRVEEKFTKAESWRLKEARRVESREAQLLELKEELAQLKSRHIDAENNIILQQLRRENEQREIQLQKLTRQLEDERVAAATATQKSVEEVKALQATLEWQLPQLAAACVNRSSEEWGRKCQEMVKRLRDDLTMKALTERNELTARLKDMDDRNTELEQKRKNAMAECEFLRREVHRVEDNNKVLLDQLHTIRVYMTQRPLAAAQAAIFSGGASGNTGGGERGAPAGGGGAQHAGPPSSGHHGNGVGYASTSYSDFAAVNQLNTQLAVLHAQFQQMFDATERPAPTRVAMPSAHTPKYSSSDRFEIPSTPPPKSMHLRSAKQPDFSSSKAARSSALSPPASAPCSPTHRKRSRSFETTLDSTGLDYSGILDNVTCSPTSKHREKEQLLATLESIGLPSMRWRPASLDPSLLAVREAEPGSTAPIVPVDDTMWYQRHYWRAKYKQ